MPLPPEERPGTHCLCMGVISPAFRVFVRHIIVQVRRALVGPWVWGYACMYVCMSVRNRLTIEIYGFMHSLRTFGSCHSWCQRAMAWRSRPRTWRTEDQAMPERVQMCGRRLTAQQKDERQQGNGDKKRLARHHQSDLLSSLTSERGGGQHGVVLPALQASPFRTFHMLRVRHLMRCVYLVK